MYYHEWGDPENPRVVICAHGLTRNGRDFDALARALRKHYRVVCPDMPGRGRSDWLEDKSDYGYALYLADIAVLLGRLNIVEVDWVGTSMGGLIGMLLAAQAGNPIRRLVMNDIGPFIAAEAIRRIGEYVDKDPRFDDLDALEGHLRRVYAPFGALTDGQWRHLAKHSARPIADGGYALHHDPGIAASFKTNAGVAMDLWSVWDTLRCPVLALRGEGSDVLSPDTLAQMATRGPVVTCHQFAGIGHAPMFMDAEQIGVLRDWLTAK